MNLNFTRSWLDADRGPSPDASPPYEESVWLAMQLGDVITRCDWQELDLWEKEAQERLSAFTTMALAIIKHIRSAAQKIISDEQMGDPLTVPVLHERMKGVINAEVESPAFATAVDELAEQIQPALLHALMTMPDGHERSSLELFSATTYSGVRALAPTSSSPNILQKMEEDQRLASLPLQERSPKAIMFALMGEVANTILELTGEAKVYRDRNPFQEEELAAFKAWPERVRENPLPVVSAE